MDSKVERCKDVCYGSIDFVQAGCVVIIHTFLDRSWYGLELDRLYVQEAVCTVVLVDKIQ